MLFLLRPANLFVIFTYFILSLAPFVPLLLGQTVDQPIPIAGMEIIGWITIWSLFKRPAWFHWLLLPAFFALPIEIYLHAYYGQGISPHHLGIIAETSPKESLEFLGNKAWWLFAILLSVIVWWGASWKAAQSTRDLDWTDKSRWFFITFLIIILCAVGYEHEFSIQAWLPHSLSTTHSISAITPSLHSASSASDGTVALDDEEDEDEEEDDEVAASIALASARVFYPAPKKRSQPLSFWAQVFSFDVDIFSKSWPFGLGVQGYRFWKEREYLSDLTHKSNLFKFGAHSAVYPNTPPQVVVMVIGESSRYDRWSLNGYQRDTNPLLKKETNLVSLSDVITSVSATRLSVPVMISRKPAKQSLKAGFSEKSFLSAFKEAGFKTYWLSNQMSFGEFDTPVSVFAKEAEVIQFLNLGGFTNHSSYDQILLEPLKNALNDPAEKKLIVLHTLGNHWNYSQRYPREYDKWQPSLFGIDSPPYTDLKIKPQINNSYDNSILYTDWFLSQVIGALKESPQPTSMMYVSDHGQVLYDGNCTLAFHGHNTQHEFHIPALVWYSNQYKSVYPAKVDHLLHNKHARLTTENVFHSLLDMADVRYSTEQLDRSFLSEKFRQHKRYVDSHGWTNYDHATFEGDCRQVIDKGTPLAQEK